MPEILYLGLWANPPYDGLSERFAHLRSDVAAAGCQLRVAHYDHLAGGISAHSLASLLAGVTAVILSGSRYDVCLDQPQRAEERALSDYQPLLRALEQRSLPLLGICYGHQLLAAADGGRLARLPAKRRSSDHPVTFVPHPLVAGIVSQPPGSTTISVPENHGMVVEAVDPQRWQVIAESIDGIEALAHRQRPWIGVQFHPEYHPESRSGHGRALLLNWLRSALI